LSAQGGGLIMFTRNGSTSTFSTAGTGTLDLFPVLEPLNPYAYPQNPDSLLSAGTINKYFDAAYKLQLTLADTVGANVVSNYPGSSEYVSGNNLDVSYSYTPFSLTSNTYVVSGTVPAQFGGDPFHDPGFSMATSIMYNVGMNNDLVGSWHNFSYPTLGPFNSLLSQPQFFVSVTPIGGSNYIATILNVPMHSTSLDFSYLNQTSFTDYFTTDPIDIRLSPRYLSKLNSGLPFFNGRLRGLQCNSTQSGIVTCGLLCVSSIRAADSSMQFGPVTITNNTPTTGLPVNRSGVALRVTWPSSDTSHASFYALSIGDVLTGTYTKTTARVLRVTNHNLSQSVADNTNNWYGDGSVTDLCSLLSVSYPDLGSVSYTAFLFSVSGSVINLQYQTASSSAWTSFSGFPLTDPSPLTNFTDGSLPYSGFFSKSLIGNATTSYPNTALNAVTLKGPVILTNLGGSQSVPCALSVLYFNIGPDSSLPIIT